MAVGDIKSTGAPAMPAAVQGMMGPVTAMRKALAAYLLKATFRVDGGADIRDSLFQLEKALDHFPRSSEELVYPCVSIIEMPETTHDQPLSPEPLEDTLGTFDSMIGATGEGDPKTCLWALGEAETMLQVDFWTNNDPDRQAIEGELANLFMPEEGRSSVVLEAPELYFGTGIEFEVMAQHHDDSAVFTQRNERRLRCVVAATCAIVSLRMATLTATPVTCVTVVDPVDPPPWVEDEED